MAQARARRLRFNAAEADERSCASSPGGARAELEPVPAEPERVEPGQGEPLSRDIAAFDRSGG